MSRKDWFVLSFACFFFTGLLLLSLSHPFFWDTVLLSSRHASWFLGHHFSSILLPDELDSGHIPFTGYYLALWWKLFGRTIEVAHLSVLPWIFGLLVQLWVLVKKFIPEKWNIIAFIILLSNPVLLGQLVLISPDIILVFFFLLALNSILSDRKILLAVALTGLILSSLRGMFIVAGLFIFNFYLKYITSDRKFRLPDLLKLIPIWLPSGLVTLAYLVFHFLEKGWIRFHAGSPWADNFTTVGWSKFIYNLGILGWRFIDFGHLFSWLILFYLFFRYRKKHALITEKARKIMVLWTILLVSITPAMLLYKGLMNHRYLLPLYILQILLVLHWISIITLNKNTRIIIFSILFLGLLSGNCWKYPDGIATGWDSTLSHWPWYSLRDQAIREIKRDQINPSSVGTDFPELSMQDDINPGSGMWKFSRVDTSLNKYMLWSNVMNGFPDEVRIHIDRYWVRKKEWKSCGVRVILYQNPQQ